MTNLDALIERVRGLEGPDRLTDCDIRLVVLGDCPFGHEGPRSAPKPGKLSGYVEAFRPLINEDDDVDSETVPRYTASLDAVVSLIERELPKCQWSIESGHGCITATITYRWKIGEIGATPALALLRALFSAIKEQRND